MVRATSHGKKLQKAFAHFVRLLKPVPQVLYVAGFDGGEPDFFTYIQSRDEDVCMLIFQAEDSITEEFPDLLVDFHTTYLQGRPIRDFIDPPPALFFARRDDDADGAGPSGPSPA